MSLTETNSSWQIYKLIKSVDIKTSMLFNLSFANNIILSCFFFFFLINDLYFLVPSVIAQICIPTAEPEIPTKTVNNEANAEIET